MPKGRPTDKAGIARILELRGKGIMMKKIPAMTGFSLKTVYKVCSGQLDGLPKPTIPIQKVLESQTFKCHVCGAKIFIKPCVACSARHQIDRTLKNERSLIQELS